MKKSCAVAALTVLITSGCKRAQEPASPTAAVTPEPTPFVITTGTKWKTVEEFQYAWKSGQALVHFKLELPEGYNDPGDFVRIRIQVPGRPEFVLENQDGWVEYNNQDEKSEVYETLTKRNLVESKYAVILPASSRKGESPLVFLRSWGYASNAERLHVIGFTPSGEPITLINENLELVGLSDLDGDGYYEIVGQPCVGEQFGSFQSYTPYHVYKIQRPISSPAQPSAALSRTYNLKHYYGWAGLECSYETVIVLHPPGGGEPVIMKKDEAENLMRNSADSK